MNTFLLFPLKSYWIESFCPSVLTECIQLTLQKVTEVYHDLCMVPSIRLPIYLHEQTTENYQKPRKTTQKKQPGKPLSYTSKYGKTNRETINIAFNMVSCTFPITLLKETTFFIRKI